MKKILLSTFFAVVVFSTAFAQIPASFNYQAVVRNSAGEILANKTVSFRISLLKNSKTGAVVYSEKHKVTTNDFGLVNLKIGKGTKISGNFSPAGWGDVIFTKIEIDPAGGSSFSELANSKLSSVPFAFKAQTVVNDKVDDADADPTNEIQKLKLTGTLLELSAGGGSVTLPTSGSGGGDNWGAQTVKTDATLSGNGTTASPLSVTGDLTDDQTLSLSGNDLSIDGGNTITLPTATNTSGWTDDGSVVRLSTSTDKVGIGTENPSAALHVTGNDGVLFQGTYDNGTVLNLGTGTRMMWYPKKSAFRAGYVKGTKWDDANIGDFSTAMGYSTTASISCSTAMGSSTTASGANSTAMGNSTIASGQNSTAMGRQTRASEENSTALGYITKATGQYSTAMGHGSTASGGTSIAMGSYTTASGSYSTTMGEETTASSDYCTAMGRSTTASGAYSTAMGYNTLADSYLLTAIGRNNVGNNGNPHNWVETDPLFEIGNGKDGAHRANAVTVYKNGNTHISGTITSGTTNVSLPIAYGVINTGGSVNNATNNVSSTWVTDHYEISISGESYSQTGYVCTIEALGISPVMTTTGASGGKLLVYIYNTLGTQIKDAFHFVIYKL